jgi:hypothetical protein
MTKYEAYCERKTAEYGARFVRPSGSAELVAAFNDGGRYEVDINGPGFERYVKRGRVGITTGWQPCFLLMLTRRSMGSSITLDAKSVILRRVAA